MKNTGRRKKLTQIIKRKKTLSTEITFINGRRIKKRERERAKDDCS